MKSEHHNPNVTYVIYSSGIYISPRGLIVIQAQKNNCSFFCCGTGTDLKFMRLQKFSEAVYETVFLYEVCNFVLLFSTRQFFPKLQHECKNML